MNKTCANKKCQKLFTSSCQQQKYCCPNCQNATNHRKWFQATKKPCPDCGKPIKQKAKYCKKCNGIHRSDHILDMTLDEYIGQAKLPKHLPSKYNKIRSLARNQYRHLILKPCYSCGYDKHVHICHIKPIFSFPKSTTIREINILKNIIQLCPNCHWELDNKLLIL